MQSSKGFAPIVFVLVILVLALVCGGAFYISKSANKPISITIHPTNTKSLNSNQLTTYTSSKLYFSFQTHEQIKMDEQQIGDFYAATISFAGGSIVIAPQGKDTDSICTFGQPLPSITKRNMTFNIGGQNITGEITVLDNGKAWMTCKRIAYHGYDFVIYNNDGSPSTLQSIDQILSTLQYTDQNQTSTESFVWHIETPNVNIIAFSITDSSGKITGYNPNDKTIHYDILNSIYDNKAGSIVDPSSSTMLQSIQFNENNPKPGKYTLKVYGKMNGAYHLEDSLAKASNILSSQSIDGTATVNSVDTYTIDIPNQTNYKSN